MATLSNQSVNTVTVTNQSLSGASLTWDEATYTWDNATGTWDQPFKPFNNQTVNTTTLSNQTAS